MRLRKLSAWILYRWHGPKWHQRIRQGCQLPPSYKLFTWIFIESYSHDSIFSRDWILEDDRQLRLETLTVVSCCDQHYELAFNKNIEHSLGRLMTDVVGYPKTRKGKTRLCDTRPNPPNLTQTRLLLPDYITKIGASIGYLRSLNSAL